MIAPAESPLLEAQDLELSGGSFGSSSFRVTGTSLACPESAGRLVDAIFDPNLILKGTLRIGGASVQESLRTGQTGLVPDRLPLPDSARVGKSLLMSARLIGYGYDEVDEALERCGILKLTKKHLKALSPLEHRLVSLAHAITGNPEILVLSHLFHELGQEATSQLSTVIERTLENRKWIALTHDDLPASLRLNLCAEHVLSRQTMSPQRAVDFIPEAYWVRSHHSLEALAETLEKKGTRVSVGPNPLSLLVHGQRAQDIFANALKLGISLTEMMPAQSDGFSATRARSDA